MLSARYYLAATTLSLCLAVPGITLGFESAVVDSDTTIDAASPLAGKRIDIIDGAGGPTEVGIVAGGTIAGFVGRDKSVTTLDGGAISYVSSLEDNASFVFNSGTYGCTEAICEISLFSEFFTARDSSQLLIHGGILQGIRLYDAAEAHIYGSNLSLNLENPTQAIVEGTYANGAPVNVLFFINAGSTEGIFLHNVPEPALCGLAILGLLHVSSRRAKRGDSTLVRHGLA
jgi:hypothetical protein